MGPARGAAGGAPIGSRWAGRGEAADMVARGAPGSLVGVEVCGVDLGAGPGLQVLGLISTGVVVGWALTVLVERPAYRALCRWRDRRLPAGAGHVRVKATAPVRTAGPRPTSCRASRVRPGAIRRGGSGDVLRCCSCPGRAGVLRGDPAPGRDTGGAVCLRRTGDVLRARQGRHGLFGVAGVCWLLYNGLVIPEIGELGWDSTADSRRICPLLGAALLGIALNWLLYARPSCPRIEPGDDRWDPHR